MQTNTSDYNDFATVPELAARWRCTPQHVFNLIRRGALPAVRIGARVIVSQRAAQDFAESGETSKTAQAAQTAQTVKTAA